MHCSEGDGTIPIEDDCLGGLEEEEEDDDDDEEGKRAYLSTRAFTSYAS